MGENSKIEWTDNTFNPVMGCMKVSDGCKFCYAEEMMDHRYGKAQWGPNTTRVRTSLANWRKPYQWNKAAERLGIRYKVFCASLSDVFEDHPDWVQPRRDLLHMITETPYLDWQLLTKRPENVLRLVEQAGEGLMELYPLTSAKKWLRWLKHGRDYALPNVWFGTSVENQEAANKRIPELLKIPAAVRFLSMEPLLGPVKLDNGQNSYLTCTNTDESHECCESFAVYGEHYHGIDWIVTGGESGTHARPMNPNWARSIRDQCQAAGVAYFHKQNGEWASVSEVEGAGQHYHFEDGATVRRVGKHAAGRLLDGVEWSQFPSM